MNGFQCCDKIEPLSRERFSYEKTLAEEGAAQSPMPALPFGGNTPSGIAGWLDLAQSPMPEGLCLCSLSRQWFSNAQTHRPEKES